MALYSCNLSSVGRSTHSAGTAGAHLRYIGRTGAEAEILCEHMPDNPQKARSWMDAQEKADRKNARVMDKIRVALPVEFDEQKRAQLVRDYMEEITQGNRVPWYAAIHQTGDDAHNPHAHIVIRDRDTETGKRVVCLSDSKRDWQKKGNPEETPVQWVRERWEHHTNAAYEREGMAQRVDRRTLQAQGIDREPTIHLGANGQHVEQFKQRPESKPVPDTTWRKQYRDETPYPDIDQGRTRAERNAEIIDFNLEKAIRSKDFATSINAQAEKRMGQVEQDMKRRHIAIQRRLSDQEGNIKAKHREIIQQHLTARNKAIAAAKADSTWELDNRLRQLDNMHVIELAQLKDQQTTLKARVLRKVDITGGTRRKQDEEKQQLLHVQSQQRLQQQREAEALHRKQAQQIMQDYAPALQEARAERAAHLAHMQARHAQDKQRIQQEQQEHERQREQARQQAAEQVRVHKQQQRMAQQEPQPLKQARATSPSPVQEQFNATRQEDERQRRIADLKQKMQSPSRDAGRKLTP